MTLSLSQKMAAAADRPSGFDYLRLALALSVVGVHFIQLGYGYNYWHSFWHAWSRPFMAIILPMFFALSGFLVTRSLLRSKTLITFLGLRALRIVPALMVETILCACILGPLFTTMPLSQYFSSGMFYRYFLNIVGDVHFALPGVFAGNPYPGIVNQQLWTIPWEFYCYAMIAGMSLLALFRNKAWLIAFVGLFNLAVLGYYWNPPPGLWVGITNAFWFVHPVTLIEAFLAGVILFIFGDRLPHNLWISFASLVAALLLLVLPHGDYLASFPIAYFTVYLGLLNPARNKILLSGDYSYGIYLYGYPIQQAVTCVHGVDRNWHYDMAWALPLILLTAAASWWLVEKPALSMKAYLPTNGGAR